MSNFNAKKAKEEIIEWIKNWFMINGNDCKAIVGISGGKDSTIVAALCVEALGKDRVIGILMPNGEQTDIQDSYDVVHYLNIRFLRININKVVDSILLSLKYPYGGNIPFVMATEQAKINLPPRIRMTTLYAVSQSMNGRVANTCNLSEDMVGYSTRWGDNVGDFSPLGRYTATEVIEIGKELGLPSYLVEKTPSDGLCGKTDEDNLGFSYKVLDTFLRTGECNEEDKKRILNLYDKNKFKLKMPETCPNELPVFI